jgi:hypothetical protein
LFRKNASAERQRTIWAGGIRPEVAPPGVGRRPAVPKRTVVCLPPAVTISACIAST